jgi:histidyl-tRNA synthetase
VYQAPRGTQDILPESTAVWRHVERCAEATARRFGYGEIRTPTFEDANLFLRGVGEGTDIVDKEIYRFRDKGDADLALRPEGTASTMRAYLQHGMSSRPQPVKLYSILTVFRYDRPQAGRYREFRQFNVEAIGDEDPLLDAEVIGVLWRFLADLGLRDLTVLLNSIGDPACRPGYISALAAYFDPHKDELCGDCRRRLETNPLRLLDCKNAPCQPFIKHAPKTIDYLCDACRDHFEAVRGYLKAAGLPFELEPKLVRGLDYYTRTVFEVVPPKIGAQATIGGGGRYDGLAELLGGRHTPAVGFAAGLDRIILNLREQGCPLPPADTPDVFIAPIGAAAKVTAVQLAEQLRAAKLATVIGSGERGMRARLRQADASGAGVAIILGDDEVRDEQATVKNLAGGEQVRVAFGALVAHLTQTDRPTDGGGEARS